MKIQLVLLAGSLTGITLVAAPALSQNNTSPQSPTRQTSPTDRTRDLGGKDTFHQAVKLLEGTWQVTVKPTASGGLGDTDKSAAEMSGTSTREWILNNKILTEEVRLNGGSQPGSGVGGNSMAPQSFHGHGMFGYDKDTNQFQHVWSDSTDSKLSYCTGRYDERTRTFTFNKTDAGTMPRRDLDPTMTPPQRPGGAEPITPPARPGGSPDLMQVTPPSQVPPITPPSTPPTTRPGQNPPQTPGQTPTRPGVGGDQPWGEHNLNKVQRIVIRILDDNRHTVEYFTDATGAQQSKVMEVTYTKSR